MEFFLSFFKLTRRTFTTAAAAITLAATVIAPAAQADPFDGFFSAEPQASTDANDVSRFFEAVNTPDAEVAARLVEGINMRVAAMRLANNAWWAASDESRDAFLKALAATLTARLRGMNILTVQVADIQPGDADRVFVATGDILREDAPALSVRWALREDQGSLRIIEADIPDGTLLLPETARDALSDDGAELATITDILRATLP